MGITTWEMGYVSPGFEILGWTFPPNHVFLSFFGKCAKIFSFYYISKIKWMKSKEKLEFGVGKWL